jgi:hypothetical protein
MISLCRRVKMAKYTCNEYRQEMRLIGMKRRLKEENLSEAEKKELEKEIEALEAAMEMD